MTIDLDAAIREFHPRDEALLPVMWQLTTAIRGRCPVAHSEQDGGFWLVTGYESASRVLQDAKAFSSDKSAMVPAVPPDRHRIGLPPTQTDPPRQSDYRRILNPFLSPQAVAGFDPGIRAIVTDLIDRFVGDGRCDIVSQLARPFPGRVLFRLMLGILDDEEVERCSRWARAVTYEMHSPGYPEIEREFNDWILELIAARRRTPRHDIIGALVEGLVEGEPIPEEELVATIKNVILGGFGTTADATSWAALKLAQDPALQDRLRSGAYEMTAAVEEILRLEPPVISLFRICRRDTEVAGQKIRAGDRVLVHLGSANRDPGEFVHENQMDLTREYNRHLTFGLGPHRCVGSNLARLSVRVVVEEMVGRLPDMRLASGVDPEQRVQSPAWGLHSLIVEFTASR
ncbi:MAG: cytochrome P450 [Actinomycetota bacterium]|nr:cytochrome P450 [Actinomycetota bacterium]